jgi:CrcB protein
MLGGAAGAPLRFAMSIFITRALDQPSFPIATLTVNVLGSFLLACLTWASAGRFGINADTRVLLGIGVLGAFTTYSTFSIETVLLFERSRLVAAASYMSLTVALCVLAAFLGMLIAKTYL